MRLLLTFSLSLATVAQAWPVDWIHDVEPKKERFVRLPALDWFEVEDPSIAQVEWMEHSHELLITGLRPGRTLLLLAAEGKFAVWRLRVGQKPLLDEKLSLAAQKVCPDLKWTPLEDVKLAVTAHSEPCRQALLALFQTDAVEARAIELTFSPEVLQAQLKELHGAFDKLAPGKVKARYVGAGLVLTGAVSQAEYRKLLWELLRRSLGRFAVDDQLEVSAPPPDAGSSPKR